MAIIWFRGHKVRFPLTLTMISESGQLNIDKKNYPAYWNKISKLWQFAKDMFLQIWIFRVHSNTNILCVEYCSKILTSQFSCKSDLPLITTRFTQYLILLKDFMPHVTLRLCIWTGHFKAGIVLEKTSHKKTVDQSAWRSNRRWQQSGSQTQLFLENCSCLNIFSIHEEY